MIIIDMTGTQFFVINHNIIIKIYEQQSVTEISVIAAVDQFQTKGYAQLVKVK
jgi:hypothetical protein